MSKGSGNGWLWVGLTLLALAGIVYYSETGQGENNSTLIPDSLEGRIDFLVGALNQRFGKRWLDAGVEAIRHYLATAHPSLLALTEVIIRVELASRGQFMMSSYNKQQMAVRFARGLSA